MKKIIILLLTLLLIFAAGCEQTDPTFRNFIIFQDTETYTRTLVTPDKVLRDGIPARVEVVGVLEEKMYHYPYKEKSLWGQIETGHIQYFV